MPRAWNQGVISNGRHTTAGLLPGKKKCKQGCGKSVVTVPVAKTPHWIALDPAPEQRLGEYVVDHGEARRLNTGETGGSWRYLVHVCAEKPKPQSQAIDLFGTDAPEEPANAPESLTEAPPDPYEPPIVGDDDPWTSKVAAERIEPTRGTKRAAVLDLLRVRDDWVDGPDILRVGGTEGLRRLRELRSMGWTIARRPDPQSESSWQYRLQTESDPDVP